MSLFKLVHSLSTAEKRCFVVQNDMSKKYMKLYKKINHQQEENNAYLDQAGFNATDRNTLYKKILETLSILRLHKPDKIESYLKFWIDSFTELLERNLIVDLGKKIPVVKKFAYIYEKFTYLLEIIKFEKALLYKRVQTDSLKQYHELMKEEAVIVNYINEDIEYYNLLKQVFIIRATDYHLTNPENRALFQKCADSNLLKSSSLPYSKISKVFYYKLNIIFALHQQNSKRTFQLIPLLLNHFESHKDFLAHYPVKYFGSLQIAMQSCFKFENYTLVNELLQKIELAEGVNEKTQYESICYYGLAYAIEIADKDFGSKYVDIFKHLQKDNPSFFSHSTTLMLCYYVAAFKCLFAEWESAKNWLNKILKYKQNEATKTIQCQARLLKCVIEVELEQELDNHLQAIRKYYKSHQLDNEITRQIFFYFKKINNANCNEKQSIIQQFNLYLKNTMNKLSHQEKHPQLDLNILELWTRSRMGKIAIAEVINQEKLVAVN